jgi:hypothetical protein
MPIVISGTNGISGVDGTASNPSYEGTDANTGVFFPAADTVAIGTNGTEALRVNSSQNVGIGTQSPVSISGYTIQTLNNATNGSATYYQRAGTTLGRVIAESGNLTVGAIAAGGNLIFESSGTTERARLNSGGAFVFAGGDTGANGIGITFPATQSASTNANTLDDYEEGSWTPTATPTSGSLTSSTRNGSYVKIGNVVVARFSILFTNVGTASGAMTIGGLPFTVENITGRSFIALVREDDQTGNTYQGCPIGNTTTASVHNLTNGSIAWTNNYRYVGCFTYIVA